MTRAVALSLLLAFTSFAEHRLISIGDRRLSIDCDGPAGPPTVILIAGGGRTAKDWDQVQPAVAAFARVCSYDRAGFGESDKVPEKIQPVDQVVDDLHALLKASGENGPFLLVPHSIAGIYVRRYLVRFPADVSGLVFVDSSHEEQALRLHQVDPKGPAPNEQTAQLGFYTKPDAKLEWKTNLPLIVLAHGKPYPRNAQMTDDQWAAWDRIWRGFQQDLANRSTRGELRVAEKSGHFIQKDQPELVIQSIRDVIRQGR